MIVKLYDIIKNQYIQFHIFVHKWSFFYYFVVHKKVKIQSHELISLHHILSSKKAT